MMFGLFTDAVENVLDITGDILTGEVPTKRKVAKLVDAGLTVGAIAIAFNVGEDVIAGMIDQ